MSQGISSIYNHGPAPEPRGAEAEERNAASRRALWHRHGVALINPEQVHDDFERQVILNVANRIYGQRKD